MKPTSLQIKPAKIRKKEIFRKIKKKIRPLLILPNATEIFNKKKKKECDANKIIYYNCDYKKNYASNNTKLKN